LECGPAGGQPIRNPPAGEARRACTQCRSGAEPSVGLATLFTGQVRSKNCSLSLIRRGKGEVFVAVRRQTLSSPLARPARSLASVTSRPLSRAAREIRARPLVNAADNIRRPTFCLSFRPSPKRASGGIPKSMKRSYASCVMNCMEEAKVSPLNVYRTPS